MVVFGAVMSSSSVGRGSFARYSYTNYQNIEIVEEPKSCPVLVSASCPKKASFDKNSCYPFFAVVLDKLAFHDASYY